MKSFVILILAVFLAPSASADQHDALQGTWKPVSYIVDGVEYPLSGLMIITPGYLSANTLFKLSDESPGDANANAGPYELHGDKIIMNQWMQLHWRPQHEDDPEQHFLAQDVPEEIPYRVEGDRLIFHFPSGNKYISQRLDDG